MENDIVANEKVLDEYNEQKNNNSDFEWLYKSIINDPKYDNLSYDERYKLFLDCCTVFTENLISIKNEPEVVEEDPENNKLYMYFISLDNDKMFLHTDFKNEYDEIMKYCENEYEYVKQNKPKKVVFILEIFDLYDVDKYVKMFMHMFGIDETRGGSYIDVELPDYLIKTIEFEKKITNMDFYIKKNNL